MNEKQQIKEMAFNLIMATSPLGVKDLTKQFDYETVAKDLYELYGWRKQSEWISVDERLPTDERNVLCYYGFDRGDGDLGMMFIGVLSYFAYDSNPHFQHESMGLRVTHWMPLPEAPKGGVQE